ncbi:MAG: beta strand repeat-containing protein, partial [Pseudomonadales bacterium]
ATFDVTGASNLGADVTTTDGQSYGGAVILGNNLTLSTGAGSGNISFASTVDATTANTQTLAITAGTGNIDFDGAVGSNTSLGAITINSVNNLTADSTINAASFQQIAGTQTTLAGLLSTTGSVNLNAATLDINGGISGNTGINLNAASALNLGSSLTTVGNDIVFNDAVTLDGAAVISTGTAAGGNINFTNTVNGGQLLTLTAGTGGITFANAVGNSAALSSLTISSASQVDVDNTLQVAGNIDIDAAVVNFDNTVTTTGNGSLTVSNTGALTISNAVNLDGAFNQDAAGAVNLGGSITTTADDIAFDGPLSLTADVMLNSAAGNIDFASGATINGSQALTLSAATGTISFAGAIGANTPLTTLNINSASQATFGSTLASSGNIDINAGVVNFNNTVTTSSNGALTVTNTGALSIANALNLDGAFNQDGTGSVNLGGNITTSSDNISFDGAVLLGSDLALSTGTAGGNIDFAGTSVVNGDQLLTLSAGTGSVTFGAAVGNATALSGLAINNASQIDFDNTLAVDDQGIDIDAGVVNFDSTVTTSNSGGLSVTNTGTLTTLGGLNLDGGLTQDGNGVVSLGGDITTTADNINFDGALILSSNVALSTGGTTGNIDFDSSINGGANSLSLNSGAAGTIDVAGQLTNVGSLTITNSNGATFRDDVSVSSVTITDTADDATVVFQDNLTAGSLVTSAEGYGVSLLGATTTITADTSFNNTGATVIGDQASDIIQFINGLDATSAGGVSLAGTIRTTGENIDLGSTSITQAARLDTTNNGADVNGANITTGAVTATNDALALNAGNAGTVSVGSIAGVSNLELVQSGGATFRDDVTATSVILTDTADGATIQFDGSLTATALTTTTGNGYNLTFNGPSTTINNALIFSNSGVLTFGNEASDDILFNGGATTDPAATVNIFGAVRTTGDILNLGNVNVLGASSLQTVGANLILSGITSTGNQALDVSSGAITVSGAVDDIALTIKDSGGATFQGQVGVNSPVSLIIENTTAGQDVTFLAETALTNLTTAAQGFGLSFTGSTNNFTNLVELNNTGGIVFGNGADAFTFNGGVRNNNVSTISLSGS